MTPRAQERLFKKGYAKELLNIAQSDLQCAHVLFQANTIRLETVGFLCQQCIEKALKAVLVNLEIPVPMVHEAGILVAKLPSHLTPPQGYDLSQLSPFATQLRYEEGKVELRLEDVKGIMVVSEQVLKWAKQQITGG